MASVRCFGAMLDGDLLFEYPSVPSSFAYTTAFLNWAYQRFPEHIKEGKIFRFPSNAQNYLFVMKDGQYMVYAFLDESQDTDCDYTADKFLSAAIISIRWTLIRFRTPYITGKLPVVRPQPSEQVDASFDPLGLIKPPADLLYLLDLRQVPPLRPLDIASSSAHKEQIKDENQTALTSRPLTVGAPNLQPFPRASLAQNLNLNESLNSGLVFNRELVRDALTNLAQNENYVEMVYQQILKAQKDY